MFEHANRNVKASQSDLEFARKQRDRAEDSYMLATRMLRTAELRAGRGPGGVFLRFETVVRTEGDPDLGVMPDVRVMDDAEAEAETPADRPGLSSI